MKDKTLLSRRDALNGLATGAIASTGATVISSSATQAAEQAGASGAEQAAGAAIPGNPYGGRPAAALLCLRITG